MSEWRAGETQDAYLLALSHEEAQHALKEPFKAVRVESNDVRGNNDQQRDAESIDNHTRIAIRGIEIPSEEACVMNRYDKLQGVVVGGRGRHTN